MFEHLSSVLIEAAKAAMPNEMCGVIYNDVFIQLVNAAPDPSTKFALTDADALRYLSDPKTQAIVHSHPSSGEEGPGPSKHDLEQQLATNLPWVIVAFDPRAGKWSLVEWDDQAEGVPLRETSLLNTPILGQTFVYGVHDCFNLGRKWYWQTNGIRLPPMPSNFGWWGEGGKLYEDNFERLGFERFAPVTPADLIPGDAFLYAFGRTFVYNHIGIFVGNGLAIEHRLGELSNEYVVGPWLRRTSFWVRFTGAD